MSTFLINAGFGYITCILIILIVWGTVKLIKKEKLKSINYKIVLLVSLIGIVTPTLDLINGKYQGKSFNEISKIDEESLKKIIQSCLSGYEISPDIHKEFYALVDKYNMNKADIDEVFSLFYNDDLIQLQKSFYSDALNTIKLDRIFESKERSELESKLLNDTQKERNKEYLRKINSKQPIELNGESVVLNEEICLSIMNNLEGIYEIAKNNINTLKNRQAFY